MGYETASGKSKGTRGQTSEAKPSVARKRLRKRAPHFCSPSAIEHRDELTIAPCAAPRADTECGMGRRDW